MAEPAIIPPRKSKAKRAYAVLGTLTVAVLAVYYVHGYLTRNDVATDDAQVDADVLPIAARVGGVVVHMKVRDNQKVEAGTVIAEIDPADYAKRVAAAEADLAAANELAAAADAQVEIVKSTSKGGLSSAKAMLEGTGASVRSAVAQAQAVQASLARAQAESAKAENDFQRAKKLHDAGAVSGQQLEAAQVARDAAKDAVDAAQANLAAARDAQSQARSRVAEAAGHVEQSTAGDRQIAAAEAASKAAHASAQASQAALDLARLQLGYTRIVAPVAGYASRLAVHEGQMVQPGATIVLIVPVETYVIANFKETQLARIRPGDPAEISVDALGGTTFRGKVDSISPATGARFSLIPPDNATGNFVKVVQRVPVKIVWTEGADSQLHAGLSVEVKVHLQ
jgi:membrane fusion protein (multidrug efflux system)